MFSTLDVGPRDAQTVETKPEFFRLPKSGVRDPHFGLPRTTYYELEKAGTIRLVRLREARQRSRHYANPIRSSSRVFARFVCGGGEITVSLPSVLEAPSPRGNDRIKEPLLKTPRESLETISTRNEMLVSCVASALDTATQHYDPKEIIESIRADKLFTLREPILKIRATFANVMASTGGDRKAAKQAVDGNKKRLPGVMWSGTFSQRKWDALLQHSGLLCADLDGLGDRVVDVRTKLANSLHLWALFTSPTGDGLKAVFRVPPDAEQHKASFRAVENHVGELTGVQIDQACSDVARLCFLSHDPGAYLNDDALELPPLPQAEKSPTATATSPKTEIETRRRVAAELVGDIQWTSETCGYCNCPAQHLHTGGDGVRDCEVYLDGAPTIYCFHNSCRDIIQNLNHQLRSQIGKVERAAAVPDNSSESVAPDACPAFCSAIRRGFALRRSLEAVAPVGRHKVATGFRWRRLS